MGSVEIDFVARTAALEAGLDKVKKQIAGVTGETQRFGKETVSGMQASSAAIREMSGSLNTRAIERFIAQSKTLSSVLQTAFPLIGGLAFSRLLIDMGQAVYKTGQQAVQAGNNIKNAFGSLTGTMETANAELQVTNDKLHNQLDLLTGKRPNTLKQLLDEDKLAADKFADSLQTVDKNIQAILKENGIGTFSMIAAGALGTYTHSTSDIDKMVKKDNQENTNNAGYIHDATIGGNKDSIAAAVKNAVDALNRQITGMEQDLNRYKKLDNMLTKEGRPTEYDAQRNDLSGIIRARQDQVTAYGLTKDNGATSAAVEKAKGDKEAAEQSKKALNQFIEEMRKAAESVTKINADIEEARQKEGLLSYRTPYSWGGNGGQMVNTSLPLQTADLSKDDPELAKAAASSEKIANANISLQESIEKAADEYRENAIKNAELNGTISKHEAAIELAEASEAAYQKQLAKLNVAMDNATTLQDMQNLQLQKIALNAQHNLTLQTSQQNINSTSNPFQKSMQDFVTGLDNFSAKLANITQNTANGLFGDIARGKGFKSTIKDGLTSASVAGQQKALQMGLDGMAKQGGVVGKIGRTLGGQATRGGPTPVVVTNWPSGGAGTGGAGSVTGAATGALGKALGIGNGKPGVGQADDSYTPVLLHRDGTPVSSTGGGVNIPYNDSGNTNTITSDVQGNGGHPGIAKFITNGWAMANGKVGASLYNMANAGPDTDSLASMDFLGFANGGEPPLNVPSIVGENGPEIFVPKTSGVVIPNNKIGGGGDIHYFQNANFSGANAAEVQSKVRAAMTQTHQQSVKDAVRVQHDQRRRSPRGR